MQEPIVFLPGMMCDARLFAPQIAAFSAQNPVMVIPSIGANTMAALAQQVLAITPPRFALAGLSMGGIVAMDIMRQAPERVTRLALMDTNPLPDPPEKAPIRHQQVAKVRAGGLHAVMREEMKPHYLADGPNKQPILDLCMQMAETLGAEVFATQSHAIELRRDQCDVLKQISVPSLVLCGQEDRLCPVSRHQLMHNLIAHSHLEIIPRAGHLPCLENPEMTNKVMKQWMNM